MQDVNKKPRACGAAGGSCCDESEALLRAEIAFWREMLGNANCALPPESLERMRFALALAEYRYLKLNRTGRCDEGSTAGPFLASPPAPGSLH